MFEYSQNILNNYDDNNYTFTGAHPKIKGVAYFDKHTQPSDDACVGQLISNVSILLFLAKLLSKMDDGKLLESYWWKS
jgi:hypothetical protein